MPIKATVSKYNDFRIWFFMYATRPIECVNTAFLFSFGAISFVNYWDLLTMPSYLRFNIITNWTWFLMVLAGIAQLTALRCKTLRSNQAPAIGTKFNVLNGQLVTDSNGKISVDIDTGIVSINC